MTNNTKKKLHEAGFHLGFHVFLPDSKQRHTKSLSCVNVKQNFRFTKIKEI